MSAYKHLVGAHLHFSFSLLFWFGVHSFNVFGFLLMVFQHHGFDTKE